MALYLWLRVDKANFVKCASVTGRVKRDTKVEGVAGPIRKLPGDQGRGGRIILENMGLELSLEMEGES